MNGKILMLLAALAFVVQDAAVKWMTAEYSVAQLLLVRTLVSAVIIALLAIVHDRRALATYQPAQHGLRGSLLLVSAATYFYGFKHLPLADAYAMFYLVPLVLTGFGALFLGESIPPRAGIAVVVGLAGVAIVVAPQLEGGELRAYFACLVGTISYAWVGVMTRRMCHAERPLTLLFYPSVMISLATLPLMPWLWITPNLADLLVFLFIGALWPVAHGLFAAALKRSPVAVLAPIEYTSILWVVLADLLIFALPPSATTILGSIVIIAACLFLVERRK
jgi:drug/metabolite transporter (DMT)-like permease